MDVRLQTASFVAGLVAVGVLGTVGALANSARLEEVEAHNVELQQQIEADRARFETPAVDGQRLQRRVDLARSLSRRGDPIAALPAALALEMPSTAWWTSLSIRAGRLELEGEGSDPAVAAEVLDGVRLIPCLEDVSLGGVRRVSRDGETTHAFRIGARVLTTRGSGPCTMDVPPPAGRDPFLSAGMAEARRRRVSLPALRRFALDDLQLVGIVDGGTAAGGSVLIRTPDGEEHPAMVGTGVGDGRARITQILGDMILLSEDVVTDRDTGAVRTRAFTMPLERPPEP